MEKTKTKWTQYAFYVLVFAVLVFCGVAAPAHAATAPELDSLEIEGDDDVIYLEEDDFDPEEDSYTVQVPEDIEHLKLYLDYDEDAYEVDVESKTGDVDERSSHWRVYVEDEGKITITLTDLENDDKETTYTIRVRYEDEDSSGSGTSDLEDVYLNTGDDYASGNRYRVDLSPEFDYEITDYVALLPYDEDVEYLNLRLSLDDDRVELEVDGVEIDLDDDYYDYVLEVTPGETITVEFTVEGEDYTLTIYCADRGADDDTYLDELAIRTRRTTSSSYDLPLSPAFDEDVTNYVIDPGSNSTLYLYAEADKDMLILVNNQPLGSYWSFDPAKVSKIEVTVYAENLEDFSTYTITYDTELTLSSLYVLGGNTQLNLSPYFTASQHSYTASVANSVSSITLHATANNNATMSVAKNGGSYSSYSGNATFTLSEGLNIFDIRLTSGSSEDHYYINVYRPASVTTIATSSQTMRVNSGNTTAIAAYNINGNNFVKLRDVAYMLSGTEKQFSVGYNQATNQVTMTTGYPYVTIGGELAIPGAYKKAVVTNQTVLLNGNYVTPMAYNIDGNNYFLLRDLAALFDFGISYSGTTVIVDTSAPYSYTR